MRHKSNKYGIDSRHTRVYLCTKNLLKRSNVSEIGLVCYFERLTQEGDVGYTLLRDGDPLAGLAGDGADPPQVTDLPLTAGRGARLSGWYQGVKDDRQSEADIRWAGTRTV